MSLHQRIRSQRTHLERSRAKSLGPLKSSPLSVSVEEALRDLPMQKTLPNYSTMTVSSRPVTYRERSNYAAELRGLVHDMSDFSRPDPWPEDMLTSSTRTVHTKLSIDCFTQALPGTTEKVSRFLRLHPDGVSNTLRAGIASDRGAYTAPRPIHPNFPRVITVREAAPATRLS